MNRCNMKINGNRIPVIQDERKREGDTPSPLEWQGLQIQSLMDIVGSIDRRQETR
jgi:hypothetical protein